MKFEKLDTVSVLSGRYAGKTGIVVGYSQIHRNHIPEMPEYQISIKELNTTVEFKEDNLVLVERYDEAKLERERLEALAKAKAERERLEEEKMAAAIRKKIEMEMTIRAQVEKEFADKKAAGSS